MSKIKINYSETFTTKHSRDFYRGRSFHYSGDWEQGVHYVCDEYNTDFVVNDSCLLACKQSHLSSSDNEPKDFVKDEYGKIIGIVSTYWDFVFYSANGVSPGVRINPTNYHWEICENINVPEEEQIWKDTGVIAKGASKTSELENDLGFVSARIEDDELVLE